MNKIIISLALVFFTPLVLAEGWGKKVNKAEWIKNFCKERKIKFEIVKGRENVSEVEKKELFKLAQDFVEQKNIIHIEPTASGKDINDPAIAKFNRACPDKKPINMNYVIESYKNDPFDHSSEDITDEEAELYGYAARCSKNMDIYKLDIDNDGKDEYILRCEDYMYDKSSRRLAPQAYRKYKTCYDNEAVYMIFNPDQCIYSRGFMSLYTECEDPLDGIFTYNNKNYYFTTQRYLDSNDTIAIREWNGEKSKHTILTINLIKEGNYVKTSRKN